MKRIHRRDFLARTAAGLVVGLPALHLGRASSCRAAGPNDEIRLAVIGMGGLDIVGGVGGRGRQLVERFGAVPGVRIVAICDADRAILDHEVEEFKKRGQRVAAFGDLRRIFDDKNIDAVAVALPNHWHALATIWACQAGKDVYVEKPFAYDLWEGRQAVAAARKYGRIVQTGTQSRSSEALRLALEFVRRGELGAMRYVHAILYRPRAAMEKVSAPTPPPATLDYDLWCGPAPKEDIRRKQLHYDWHWFWATGNGEIGNNGAHVIDVCRWFLGQNEPPRRAMSLGGRFAYDDGGETPNTHVALWDYGRVPLICEVRNLKPAKGPDPQSKFRGIGRGIVVDCEGGFFAGDSPGGAAFDRKGQKIKGFDAGQKPAAIETAHVANFIAAVRSRKRDDLHAEAQVGNVSAACLHLANVSYRLGKETPAEAIAESIRGDREASDAFDRCREHLRSADVDLTKTPALLGPWVTYDARQEQFVGPLAQRATALSHRPCREPYVVPKIESVDEKTRP